MGNYDSRKVLIEPPSACWLLPLVLTLAMATLAVGQVRAEPQAPGNRWPTCSANAAMQRLSFVHVSDIHARYNPEPNSETPVGRIRGYYEAVKRENTYTVFTNGGDDYEKGSVAEELSGGQSTREIVKALGFDVRTSAITILPGAWRRCCSTAMTPGRWCCRPTPDWPTAAATKRKAISSPGPITPSCRWAV